MLRLIVCRSWSENPKSADQNSRSLDVNYSGNCIIFSFFKSELASSSVSSHIYNIVLHCQDFTGSLWWWQRRPFNVQFSLQITVYLHSAGTFQYRNDSCMRTGTFQYHIWQFADALMNALSDMFQSRGIQREKNVYCLTETGACRLSRLSIKDNEDSHSPAILWSAIGRSWYWWSGPKMLIRASLINTQQKLFPDVNNKIHHTTSVALQHVQHVQQVQARPEDPQRQLIVHTCRTLIHGYSLLTVRQPTTSPLPFLSYPKGYRIRCKRTSLLLIVVSDLHFSYR